MATRFTDAQVASYIQNNALSGAGLQQAAQVFQLAPDQVARAQVLLARNDPAIAAASQAYEAAVAGRPDLVAENLSFYNAATNTGSGLLAVATPGTQTYFQQNPDVAAAYQQNSYGLTPDQFAQTHFERFGQFEQRVSPSGVLPVTTPTAAPTAAPTMAPPPRPIVPTPTAAPTAAPTRAPTPVPTAAPTAAPTGGTNIRYFQQNPDVAAEYARNNLGMTPEQFAQAHYTRFGQNEQRADPNILPFANATQGFAQNLNNYTSIPIGAQYNPAVVGGTGSPYSQIMRQMTPVGNPYATVLGGIPMGGYDPSIYDPNLLSNFVAERADQVAADAAAATAAQNAMDYGGFNGGLITKVMGPNPSTPDDGTMFVQKGEYIVKKDSVNKYGKGLLDQINDGKIPAKKMKSLLG